MRRRIVIAFALLAAALAALVGPAVGSAAQVSYVGKVTGQPNSGVTLDVDKTTKAASKAHHRRCRRHHRHHHRRCRRHHRHHHRHHSPAPDVGQVLALHWANINFLCGSSFTPRTIVGGDRAFDPAVPVNSKGVFTFTDSGIDHLMTISGTLTDPGHVTGTMQISDTFDGELCDSGVLHFTGDVPTG